MSLMCLVGKHAWEGCKCSVCNKVRDEGHDWSKDCEKCARCGGERKEQHQWKGCRCSACGKVRDEGHDWSKDCDKCARCGATRLQAHKWEGCQCPACGKTRDENHDWSKDCESCARCQKSRPNSHVWTGCRCSTCGKTRDTKHAWWNRSGTCSVCGQARPRTGYCNPASTQQSLARHATITKALIRDPQEAVSVKTDSHSGKSTLMLPGGEFVEFTGLSGGAGAIRTDKGWAVIHHAVYSNDIALIQRVIDLKADLDAPDLKGWTSMHHAALMGNGEIIRLLHRHGASLDLLSTQDRLSPLHVTIVYDCPDAADALLSVGADKEIKSKGELRPLHLAAMKGRVAIAMLLLDYGADVNALEINKSTALHAAAYYGHLEIAQLLVAAGAQNGVVDLRGNTPLSLAKKAGHAAVAALLERLSPPPDDRGRQDRGSFTTGMSKEQILKKLEQYAREDRPIISDSLEEHFSSIVEIMDTIGAQRQGSQSVKGQDGRSYIFDNYVLPGGLKVKAGYAQ